MEHTHVMLIHPAGQCGGWVKGSRSIYARGKQQVQPELCPDCLLHWQQPWQTPSVCLQSVGEKTGGISCTMMLMNAMIEYTR